MKINVQITTKDGIQDGDYLVDIDINNGHWKYIDDMMETTKKVPLTLNNINKAYYLNQPVKDEIKHYDWELYHKTGELKVVSTSARVYYSLLDYLNCRIDNAKESYKKFGKYGDHDVHEYTCVLFQDKGFYTTDELEKELTYVKDMKLDIKISIIK